jgi:hypothetical protein
LQISIDVERGDPKSVLLAAAENWNADSIFVAESGAGGEPCVDETATGLTTGAKCTIETVR